MLPLSIDAERPQLANGANLAGLSARGLLSLASAGMELEMKPSWQAMTPEALADQFSRYQILAMLGRGGMAAVYLARHLALDRQVAIKLLPAELSEDPEFAHRFDREGRELAKLSHPNIVRVYDSDVSESGYPYFVMEYVEGETLHRHMRRVGKLAPAEAFHIAISIAEALRHAHDAGIIHRDVKPPNVLLNPEGQVKVVDFGLVMRPSRSRAGEESLVTEAGLALGTPYYMAPERMRGGVTDHRADIYSLGVILYEMLVGKPPVGYFSPASTISKVSHRVDAIITRALQECPEMRYQNVSEMLADLQKVANPQRLSIKVTALSALAGGFISVIGFYYVKASWKEIFSSSARTSAAEISQLTAAVDSAMLIGHVDQAIKAAGPLLKTDPSGSRWLLYPSPLNRTDAGLLAQRFQGNLAEKLTDTQLQWLSRNLLHLLPNQHSVWLQSGVLSRNVQKWQAEATDPLPEKAAMLVLMPK